MSNVNVNETNEEFDFNADLEDDDDVRFVESEHKNMASNQDNKSVSSSENDKKTRKPRGKRQIVVSCAAMTDAGLKHEFIQVTTPDQEDAVFDHKAGKAEAAKKFAELYNVDLNSVSVLAPSYVVKGTGVYVSKSGNTEDKKPRIRHKLGTNDNFTPVRANAVARWKGSNIDWKIQCQFLFDTKTGNVDKVHACFDSLVDPKLYVNAEKKPVKPIGFSILNISDLKMTNTEEFQKALTEAKEFGSKIVNQ